MPYLELEVIQSQPETRQEHLERLQVLSEEGCLGAALEEIELGQLELAVDSVSSLIQFEKSEVLPVHSGRTRRFGCLACDATATVVYGDYRIQEIQAPQLGPKIKDDCINPSVSSNY